MLGDGYSDGILSEIIGTLGTSSGNVTWSVMVSNTAQGAISASARGDIDTGTWVAGDNYSFHPRCRGRAAVIKLQNASSNSAWNFENAVVISEPLGKQRKL